MRRRVWGLAIVSYALLLALSIFTRMKMPAGEYASDVGRLMEIRVHKVVHIEQTDDIVDALAEAKRKKLPISVSGARHSQGGQTLYENAIVLDMKGYDRILHIDEDRKLIRVQSGATWEKIQKAIQPLGLAMRIMQSQNLFTVGGSMSVNAHGRDLGEGPLIDSVESFRLLLASGEKLQISRTENAELFPLVIGGYGLFGIILDADLRLTDDAVYKKHVVPLDYQAFPEYFREQVLRSPDSVMAIARMSVAPDSFLKDMFVTAYLKTDEALTEDLAELNDERFVGITKFAFGLSRKFDWGKGAVWRLQKKGYLVEEEERISRNNAMRPAASFMEYADTQKTDLLQEYFIPVDRFLPFVDGLRRIVREDELNLLNVTIRYVPKNKEAMLSYAGHDSYAFVLLFNTKRTAPALQRMELSTRRLIDLALEQGGTYYLPYQLYGTTRQIKEAYPNIDAFYVAKRVWDPGLLFMNELYARYGR
ncbi:FAD-binding oxidoreductase [Paenibacillus mendelii]|uniref:FAD-binding oxidoreductase n=1 Tax=Paenibacillus mendelii TaxID=206163 RepID=A0ABV6JH92_9BACL|nr:FAD-binding oxidoreductase [Paenibacillus mendelii]MCQ6557786.1 FAD-binding oxidoreductase [Paenibacillus mendelii]